MNLIKVILVFLLMASCIATFAQSEKEYSPEIQTLKENFDSDSILLDTITRLAEKHLYTFPDKALDYAIEARKLAGENGFWEKEIQLINIIGIISKNRGELDNALKFYFESLKLSDSLSLDNWSSNALINIGNVYQAKGDFKKAVEYHMDALKIQEQLNNIDGMSLCYYNIGVALESTDSAAQALDYYIKSYEIDKSKGNEVGVFYALYGMSSTNATLGNYELARKYINEALLYTESKQDVTNVLWIQAEIGRIYKKEQKYDSALVHFYNAMHIADSLSFLNELRQAYEDIYETFKEINRHDSAFAYLKKYSDLNDTIHQKESLRVITEIQTQYETEKKEQEIELLLQKGRTDKIMQYSLLAGILLLLIIALIILRGSRQRKLANIQLSEQNFKISQQKEEIQTQAEQLALTNRELEKLSIVASETDNAVLIMDGSGKFEWINAGFTRLYEMTLQELISARGEDIISASDNPEVEKIIARCISEKITVSYETVSRKKSGETIWAQTTITPIFDSADRISKLIAIDSDITALKKAEESIMAQNNEIKSKNQSIIDSITYAKKIQEAILPPPTRLRSILPDSFIFFKPKDIVSGDFYWLYERENLIYIAVADCTGHGVPGAFMSMIGHTMLNDIVSGNFITEPSQILYKLNTGIVEALSQNPDDDDSMHDGMDLSLCILDKENKTISLSLASHSSCLITDGKLESIDGDVFSIGGIFGNSKKVSFTDHKFPLKANQTLYMYSDGYFDQYGGPDNQKFLRKRLQENLIEINSQPMDVQAIMLEKKFNDWKGKTSQLDDVIIFGVKFDSYL